MLSYGALAIGSVVGFLSGLLGKGGSAVTTPALQIFLKTPPFLALASPLPAAIPTTLSAAFAYRRRGVIDWRLVGICAVWGIPATILGSWASDLFGGKTMMILTALFVSGLGFSILLNGEHVSLPGKPYTRLQAGCVSVLVGGISGLLANAGGVLYGPLFVLYLGLPAHQALASSLMAAAATSVPGAAAHWCLGHIDWKLAGTLALASIPFSYMGARLAIYLRGRTLLRVYGTALVLFGLYDLVYTLSR